jgi:hypothetical protein
MWWRGSVFFGEGSRDTSHLVFLLLTAHRHDLIGLKNRQFCPVENDQKGKNGLENGQKGHSCEWPSQFNSIEAGVTLQLLPDDSPTERRKTGCQMTECRMTERRMTEHRMTEHRKTLSWKIPNTEWPNAELDQTSKKWHEFLHCKKYLKIISPCF